MLNKRYSKSIKRDIFCFDFLSSILVSISFLLFIEKVLRGNEMYFVGTKSVYVLLCPLPGSVVQRKDKK